MNNLHYKYTHEICCLIQRLRKKEKKKGENTYSVFITESKDLIIQN